MWISNAKIDPDGVEAVNCYFDVLLLVLCQSRSVGGRITCLQWEWSAPCARDVLIDGVRYNVVFASADPAKTEFTILVREHSWNSTASTGEKLYLDQLDSLSLCGLCCIFIYRAAADDGPRSLSLGAVLFALIPIILG